jgi:hypothetical protein
MIVDASLAISARRGEVGLLPRAHLTLLQPRRWVSCIPPHSIREPKALVSRGRGRALSPSRNDAVRELDRPHPSPLPQERTPRTMCAQCAAEPRTCRTIEHPTSNTEHRIVGRIGRSVFDVRCFSGVHGQRARPRIGGELGALNLRGNGLGVPPSGGPDRLKLELRTRGSWAGN